MAARGSLLKLLKGKKRILILSHRAADVDALASSAALYFALQKRFRITLGIPDHVNAAAAHFAEKLGIPYTLNPPNLATYDALIFIDTHSPSMMGSLQPAISSFRGMKIAIDHHASQSIIAPKKHSFIRPNALSTAQIVFDLLQESKVPIPAKSAACIAAGIIADSAAFLIGDADTFSTFSKVLSKSNVSYARLLSLVQVPKERSEKVAQLKAGQRNIIYNSHQHLLVTSEVHFFEASAANYLVQGGADVAFVAGKGGKGIILSARAASLFVEQYDFHLARDVLHPLENEFGGHAGGHAGAAAFNAVQGNTPALLNRCVELTHAFLGKKTGTTKRLKKY